MIPAHLGPRSLADLSRRPSGLAEDLSRRPEPATGADDLSYRPDNIQICSTFRLLTRLFGKYTN